MSARFYLRTLSNLTCILYRKVPAIAFFNIQGIVLCLLRFYLRILSILIRLRYRKEPGIALFRDAWDP